MIEIHTATEALTAAQRLLDAQTGAGGADFWQSYAVSPLAAILLTTAHDNAGFADLVAVRDVLVGPISDPAASADPGWVSVAERCPDPLLSSTLHRAAGLEPTTARFLLHKRPGSARTLMTFRRNTAPLRRPNDTVRHLMARASRVRGPEWRSVGWAESSWPGISRSHSPRGFDNEGEQKS